MSSVARPPLLPLATPGTGPVGVEETDASREQAALLSPRGVGPRRCGRRRTRLRRPERAAKSAKGGSRPEYPRQSSRPVPPPRAVTLLHARRTGPRNSFNGFYSFSAPGPPTPVGPPPTSRSSSPTGARRGRERSGPRPSTPAQGMGRP